MAKITRKKLARGTELVPEHLDAITSAATALRGAIVPEQMQTPSAPFSLNFTIPWVDSKYFYDNGKGEEPFYLSFCLPPLQEHFQESPLLAGTHAVNTPVPVLDGVSISFDQRDTRAPVVSPWYGCSKVLDAATDVTKHYQFTGGYDDADVGHDTGHGHFEPNPFEGFLAYDRLDGLDEMKLSIYSKRQTYFDVDSAYARLDQVNTAVEDEMLSIDLGSAGWAAGQNPAYFGGFNKQFDPYRTYVLALHAPKLHDSRAIESASPERPPAVTLNGNDYRLSEHLALVSLCISLRFKMELVSSDVNDGSGVAGNDVQNMPSHRGVAAAPTVGIDLPEAGDPVSADATEGLSTNIQALDQEFADKLRGGYDAYANLYPTEHLDSSAAYEVIAVPLHQGYPHNRLQIEQCAQHYGNQHNWAADGSIVDRRLIPIPDSFVLHHAVAMLNFTSDKVVAAAPAALSGLRNPRDSYSGLSTDCVETVWSQAKIPKAGNVVYDMGLALVTGNSADHYTYQMIGEATYNYTDEASTQFSSGLLIDAIGMPLSAVNHNGNNTYTHPWEQLLVSIPLYRNGETGKGYWRNEQGKGATSGSWGTAMARGGQGPPIFMGAGDSRTASHSGASAARSGVGSNRTSATAGSPKTAGQEQYIEVRMGVRFTVDLGANSGTPAFTHADVKAEDVAVGYGGNFVYLIGKKHLKG